VREVCTPQNTGCPRRNANKENTDNEASTTGLIVSFKAESVKPYPTGNWGREKSRLNTMCLQKSKTHDAEKRSKQGGLDWGARQHLRSATRKTAAGKKKSKAEKLVGQGERRGQEEKPQGANTAQKP